jgi:hypothetical protein
MPVSPAAIVERLDARIGQGIEGASRAHHRRRLARIGCSAQLDPPEDGVSRRGSPVRGGGSRPSELSARA